MYGPRYKWSSSSVSHFPGGGGAGKAGGSGGTQEKRTGRQPTMSEAISGRARKNKEDTQERHSKIVDVSFNFVSLGRKVRGPGLARKQAHNSCNGRICLQHSFPPPIQLQTFTCRDLQQRCYLALLSTPTRPTTSKLTRPFQARKECD